MKIIEWIKAQLNNRFNMTVIRAVSAGESTALVYVVGSPSPIVVQPKCGLEMTASAKGCDLIHIDAEGTKTVLASWERT